MVGFEVTIDADLQVFLDREAVALPKTHAGLTIKKAGFFVVLTDSTFSIRFNGAGQFYLDVSRSSYSFFFNLFDANFGVLANIGSLIYFFYPCFESLSSSGIE